MDFNDRRELLCLLVDEVIYDSGLLTIKTVLPLEQLQPVPGRGIQGIVRCAADYECVPNTGQIL